jgi:prepilin-type N-terminal cleavage/methylation domain-containing protein
MKKNKGFTLIELLVVISIMSILTVITVAQFTNAQKKARDVSRKGDLSALSKALLAYYADYGIFPSTITWGGTLADSSGYPYMKVVPKENYQSTSIPSFCYVLSTDKKSFGLFSTLENTKDSDYKGPYTHCGGKKYYYSIVSPDVKVSDLTALNP